MSKLVKELVARDLQERYGALDSAVWVELVGVDGIATNEFRRDLHSRGMRLEVVKTALFRRAVADRPLAPLARALLGPVALVTGGESVVDVAKTLGTWLPKLAGLKLRGAVLEGQFLDATAAEGLSRMPSKRDLQARVAAVIRSPAGRLAAAIGSGAARIAACVKTRIEKLEQEQPVAA